jgi:hypothetical protein
MAMMNSLSTPTAARPGRGDMTRVLGVAAVLGAGLAFTAVQHRRATRDRTTTDDRHRALATYLREHLSGSDTATLVLERLRRSYAGTKDGSLFASLLEQIQRERELLRTLLAELGESSFSTKRIATHVAGSLLKAVAGGKPGDLSLFRTLEALSIGVQGKRCMWRALQSLDQSFAAASPQRFAELEALALRQYESIEQRRLSLAPDVLTGVLTGVSTDDNLEDIASSVRSERPGPLPHVSTPRAGA